MVIAQAPRHRLAIANATYFFALDFGAAIGPTVGGRIIEHSSYGMMYTVIAVIVILCLPLYFLVLARLPRHKMTQSI
jgi:MFS family permease